MKFRIQKAAMAFGPAILLLVTPPLPASQGGAATGAGQAAAAPNNAAYVVRASDLLGKQVNNPKGDDLGKVDDLVIDIDHHGLRYVVLAAGGVLGVGNKLYTVPAGMFTVNAGSGQLVLNVEQDRLKNAPGFARDQRPNFSQETYRSEVDRWFFKEEQQRHTPSGARLIGASDLAGKKIDDRAGAVIGKIVDVAVNFGAEPAFLLTRFDKAWGGADKILPLPFNALTFPSRPDIHPRLNLDRAQIASAQGFDAKRQPNLNAPETRRRIHDELAALRATSKPNPGETQTDRQTAGGSSR